MGLGPRGAIAKERFSRCVWYSRKLTRTYQPSMAKRVFCSQFASVGPSRETLSAVMVFLAALRVGKMQDGGKISRPLWIIGPSPRHRRAFIGSLGELLPKIVLPQKLPSTFHRETANMSRVHVTIQPVHGRRRSLRQVNRPMHHLGSIRRQQGQHVSRSSPPFHQVDSAARDLIFVCQLAARTTRSLIYATKYILTGRVVFEMNMARNLQCMLKRSIVIPRRSSGHLTVDLIGPFSREASALSRVPVNLSVLRRAVPTGAVDALPCHPI